MSNKTLISIIYASLVAIAIGVVGLILDTQKLEVFVKVGEIFFVVVGIYLLIVNGEFIKTREYKIAKAGIAILIVGVLFKILHYKFADGLMGIGLFSLIVTYLAYMISNKKLRWVNYLKLLFLIALLRGKYFRVIHFAYSDELVITGEIILAILVFDFIRTNKLYMTEN